MAEGEREAIENVIEPATAIEGRRPSDLELRRRRRTTVAYVYVPLLFLTVALLGGLRIAGGSHDLIFLKPPLIAVMFGAILGGLFLRAGLIDVGKWVSSDLPMVRNLAGAAVLGSLYAATVQVFNSLLPEQGLPFWIVGFCFFWVLANLLFAEPTPRVVLRSLAGLLLIGFASKYLLLANLAAPEGGSLISRVIENPGQEAATWLLDLPRFSGATGYIQFFALALYGAALFLLPRAPEEGAASS
jgi:hypothetical protein